MSSHGKHNKNPGYKAGDHWNVCQRCGFDIYGSDTLKEWTGLMVCSSCFETRHPQDFVRGIKEDTSAKGLVTGGPVDDYVTQEIDIFATVASIIYIAHPVEISLEEVGLTFVTVLVPDAGYVETIDSILIPESGYFTG